MSFRITGLPAERFAPLFQMSDAVSYTHLTLPTNREAIRAASA